MDTVIIENFFDNFDLISGAFKKIPLYNLDDYNNKFHGNDISQAESWPGKRSQHIHEINPFLFNLIYKELNSKTNIFNNLDTTMNAVLHLRLGDSKEDWIHTDPNYYTLIVYLSETNLNSGTEIYPKNEDMPSTKIGFVQNRALLFKSHQRHKSINNYGNNLENGRLTLNCFINLR